MTLQEIQQIVSSISLIAENEKEVKELLESMFDTIKYNSETIVQEPTPGNLLISYQPTIDPDLLDINKTIEEILVEYRKLKA